MKKKLAFTLIEILIAISVFAIGILAVLRVLTWNLSTLDSTNIKLQATVLAKEWIELLYNVRDSNLEKNLSWNCVMKPSIYWDQNLDSYYLEYNNPEQFICSWYFSTDNLLQLSFDEKYYLYQAVAQKEESFDKLFEENQLCLYKDESKKLSRYAYCSSHEWWSGTIFARYLSFSPVYAGDIVNTFESESYSKSDSTQWDTAQSVSIKLPEEKILKVEAHVLYDKLGKTWDIVFESFIWNY